MTEDEQYSNANSHLQKIRNYSKKRLYQYVAPKWADDLRWTPRMKIDLCQKPTPIHRWYLPQIPDDFEIYIKRDDMTGGTIAGHKIRRLEFILAEALEKNCDTVVGYGTVSSNHCRTLAVSGKELGFHVHLCLFQLPGKREKTLKMKKLNPFHANHIIEGIVGASFHYSREPNKAGAKELQRELSQKLCDEMYSPYIVRSGEPGDLGLFGYIDCFQELLTQDINESFSDLIITCATGQSAAAFIIGNFRNGGKIRLHAFSVNHNKAKTRETLMEVLKDIGFLSQDYMEDNFSDLINILEEPLLPGPCNFTDEHTEFIRDTAKNTGTLLDPIYTGKSAYHMVKQVQTSPEIFQGKKILFFNSGSVFGLMNENFYPAAADCDSMNGS